MLILEYYEDMNKGMINKNTKKTELRSLIKTNFIERNQKVEYDYNHIDFFVCEGAHAFYDDSDKLIGFFIVNTPIYLSYKGINLYTNYKEITIELKKRKIPYEVEYDRIYIENEKIEIQIPGIIKKENKVVIYEGNGEVKGVNFELQKLNGSISFERLSSHHIPSKVTYENSNISADNGPAIRMNYDHEKYFSCHGKSRKALKYLEKQKQLVQNGKVMDAIQNDEDEIKAQTSTTYSRAIKEMKDYARTLNPNDFKSKS
jgi:hypothetical protein